MIYVMCIYRYVHSIVYALRNYFIRRVYNISRNAYFKYPKTQTETHADT